MIYSNDNLTIEVSEHGAELTSLRCDGREYLWNGDAAYWNRHSPVLFPVVAASLYENIPNSRWEVFKGARHTCFVEQTDKYCAILEKWLEEFD